MFHSLTPLRSSTTPQTIVAKPASLPSPSPSVFVAPSPPSDASTSTPPTPTNVNSSGLGPLLTSLADTAERLKTGYADDQAVKESLFKALDFEKKRNASLQNDIQTLLHKIGMLELEIRSQADQITDLSRHRDDTGKLKEERERRILAEQEVADLREVLCKMAREAEVQRQQSTEKPAQAAEEEQDGL